MAHYRSWRLIHTELSQLSFSVWRFICINNGKSFCTVWTELAQEFPEVFNHCTEQTLWNTPSVSPMYQPSPSIHLPRPLRPYSLQSLRPHPLAQDPPHPPSFHVPSSSPLSRKPTTHPPPRFPLPSLPLMSGPSLSPLPTLRDPHFSFLSSPATSFSASLYLPRFSTMRSPS